MVSEHTAFSEHTRFFELATRRRILRPVAVMVFVLVAIASLWGIPREQSDAAFTDAEVSTASLRAATMPAPTVTSCTVQTLLDLGVVFQSVTIVWTSTYAPAQVRLTVRPPGGTPVQVSSQNITATGPVAGVYTYTAVLSQGLLQNLLGNLLGGRTVLAVTELRPNSSWVSPETTRTLSISALGGLLGNTCTAP